MSEGDLSSSDLCTSCGICCSDAMFTRIVLQDGDRERLARSGYPPDLIGEKSIPLPCPMLSGTRCTIYADRPRKCASYRCEVLKAADAGTIASDAALARVREAQRLLARLREVMPEGVAVANARARWGSGKPGGAGEAAAQLAFYAYHGYMDRHFRPPGKRLVTRDLATPPEDAAV